MALDYPSLALVHNLAHPMKLDFLSAYSKQSMRFNSILSIVLIAYSSILYASTSHANTPLNSGVLLCDAIPIIVDAPEVVFVYSTLIYILLRYSPPTLNNELVICPNEQYLAVSINSSKILPPAIATS